jgi:3-oxoacyl-[acyl-carrier-protein] synthase-1
MRKVYAASDNIISSLGFTTRENADFLTAGETGIKLHEDDSKSPSSYWASQVNDRVMVQQFSEFADPKKFTRFEQLAISSIRDAVSRCHMNITGPRTLCILSTTKGSVDMFDARTKYAVEPDRAYLWKTASILQQFFNLANTPLVVSNACISGVVAIIIGARLIRSGRFDHIIVCGADLVTEFVLSGFNSFLSLCAGPCKPFDKDRQGLSLGEAAGTLVLTSDRDLSASPEICIGKGYSSNDANHISGPSRTGEGLYIAIRKALSSVEGKIDYISAHGTATPYNDEMESVAINRAQLGDVPVNSLKGFWGHTLGAAGVIETIAGIYSLRNDFLFKTLGFSESGVSQSIAVIRENRQTPVHTFLKIASGFGGCNASLVITK